jgi:hypothetical protein
VAAAWKALLWMTAVLFTDLHKHVWVVGEEWDPKAIADAAIG